MGDILALKQEPLLLMSNYKNKQTLLEIGYTFLQIESLFETELDILNIEDAL